MKNDNLLHLQEFSRFNDGAHGLVYCLSHLFTHQTFEGKGNYVLGMAYTASSRPYSVGGICSEGDYFFY